MRSRARALFVTVAAASGLACGLVRSLDGFDDEWGRDAQAEATDPDADGVDGGAPCSAPEMMWTGGTKSLSGPYLYGMAQDDGHLYVVGGAYTGDAAAAGDGGFVLRVDKEPPFAASFVATKIDQPTAITVTPLGIYCSALTSILRLDPAGGAPTGMPGAGVRENRDPGDRDGHARDPSHRWRSA